MDKNIKVEIYNDFIEKFGKTQQMLQTVEECSELQKEVLKYIRNGGNEEEMFLEICDVFNAVYSLIHIMGFTEEEIFEKRMEKLNKFHTLNFKF